MNINPPFKQCLVCHLQYPATNEFFYKDKSRPDGLHPYCKLCRKNQQKQYRNDNPEKLREAGRRNRTKNADKIKETKRRYAQEHPERERERSRKRREQDPDYWREYQRNWSKENYQKHPDKMRATSKRWRENNPERSAEVDREWRKRNPDKVNAKVARRTAKKLNAEGFYTADDVHQQLIRQKGKCHWCNVSLTDKYDVDHVIPLSRGGTNWPSNIVIACSHCNRSKGNKLPHEWEGSNGKLL